MKLSVALSSPWAGIALGPAAWGLSLQANYALVPQLCDGQIGVISLLATALTLVAIAGSLISLRAARASVESQWMNSSGGLPSEFIAWLGVGSGLIFALVIVNQFAASLIVDGCLR